MAVLCSYSSTYVGGLPTLIGLSHRGVTYSLIPIRPALSMKNAEGAVCGALNHHAGGEGGAGECDNSAKAA
jgi:hypothetical protein